jgi:uncharacterized protein
MNPVAIIDRHYAPYPVARKILIDHAMAVAQMALEVARRVSRMNPDMKFIEEAAILHDIGMFLTDMPQLGCQGSEPYISHGVLGRKLLVEEGLVRHALVCERHVGVGLSAADIRVNDFPIPERDMIPLSIEEQIICFADKFYSKVPGAGEKPLNEVRAQIARYGKEKLKVFDGWMEMFGVNDKGVPCF